MGSSPPASAAPATIADPPASVAVNATPAIARNTTLLVSISFPSESPDEATRGGR